MTFFQPIVTPQFLDCGKKNLHAVSSMRTFCFAKCTPFSLLSKKNGEETLSIQRMEEGLYLQRMEGSQGDFIKKETRLTFIQREVLVGILLGDASLRTDTGGRRYRLQVSQSEQHKQYVFHLYDIYKNLTTSPPTRLSFSDSRNPNKTYVRWTFSTTQQACFRFYGQQFYNKNGKKKCPRLIEKMLSPRSIAYWYMDDGAQKWKGKSKGVRFCTDNFSHTECKWLATA